MKNSFLNFKFISIFLIVIFLFLNSFVYGIDYFFSEVPEVIMSKLRSYVEFNDPSYYYIVGQQDGVYYITFLKKTDTLKFYISPKSSGSYWILTNESVSGFSDFFRSSGEKYQNIPWNSSPWTQPRVGCFLDSNLCLYASCNIYTDNSFSELFYESTVASKTLPSILNSSSSLAKVDFDYLIIDQGNFEPDNLKFILWNYSSGEKVFELNLSEYVDYIERLDLDNPFSDLVFKIPIGALPKFSVTTSVKYDWAVEYEAGSQVDFVVQSSVTKTVNEGKEEQSPEDKRNEELINAIEESNKELQSSIDRQTDVIKENTQTNKNIFEKIGEILSFLNPFSENFFAYKLIDLLVNALKSLFIPEDDFFSNFFNELNDWFSDRLGFLYYPLDLLFDLLDRFMNINFSEPVINIPEIKEPFTNVALIKPINFNFNSLLENDILKNVHDIYFIIVDAIIYVGLVILLYQKYEEVINK